MRLRKCPTCKTESHSVKFIFDLNYLTSVLKMDPLLIEIMGMTEDSKSDLVECDSCGTFYIRTDFEQDDKLDEYYRVLDEKGMLVPEAGTNQGKVKTISDKIKGKQTIVQNLLLLLSMAKQNYLSDAADKHFPIRVLDFGCGWGGWLKQASSIDFVKAIGFDINKYKVQRVIESGLFATTNFNELVKMGPFDVIICNDVIEHVDEPRAIIKQAVQLLSKDGVLHMRVPRFTSRDLKRSLNKMHSGKRLKAFHLGHINYFSPNTFQQIMSEFGMRPSNAGVISVNWVGGFQINNLSQALKALVKLFLFSINSKHCDTWVKK